MTEYPAVSYIMPVLNEAGYLREAVASILAQDYKGDKELVLALGPSSDGTNLIAHDLATSDSRITLVDNPRGRTPIALNLAIRHSKNPIVIRVDAHSAIPPEYTTRGVETLNRVHAYNVGGLMDARGHTSLQRAIAAAYHSKFGFGGPAYHSGAPEGESESAYLGIFRREVFEEVGYFDEQMWRAQDWELCLRIRQAGHKVWFDPELKVGYYPRDNFSSLIRQSFASGIWRGEIARRFREGKSFRHDLPPLLLVGITAGVSSALLYPHLPEAMPKPVTSAMMLSILIPVIYVISVLIAGVRAKGKGIKEKILTAAIFPAIHLPWAAGYIKGRLVGAGDATDNGRIK